MEVEKLIQLLNQRSVTPEIVKEGFHANDDRTRLQDIAFIYKINVPRALTEA